MERARQRRDEEAEARILCIIQREKDRSYWRRQNFGMKKRQGKSVRIVTEVGSSTGQKVGPTFFRGKDPIDGLWATPDVVITGMCVMPVGYGVGDHRMFVIDFLTLSLKG